MRLLRMSTRAIVTTFVVMTWTAWSHAARLPLQPAPFTLAVSHRAKVIGPGDVVLVTVVPSAPAATVEGTAFGRHVAFWRNDASAEWRGLVGVPLDTPARAHEVLVQATGPTGATVATRLALRVQPRQFATRRLTVEARFVDPPSDEGPRIQRDQARLDETFKLVTERLWRGPFVAPVPGRASSSFGRLTVLNAQPRGRHQGADFSAAAGTPVRAPNAGRVAVAADLYFSGNTIVLDHGGGLFSLFAHLSRMAVAEGSIVATGDWVGDVGATGRVTGPHLHWAVRVGDLSVDPQSLIAALANLTETPVTGTGR
jgi:murein DD-endopeptidase MepM/ murein hydrolase activator NlpD